MKTILMYVPVIQKGYIDFLNGHLDAERIFIWGDSLITQVPRLRKEIRAISPKQARDALVSLLGREDIRIAEISDLKSIAMSKHLVLPDDEVSRDIVESSLRQLGLRSFQFDQVFLRWDGQSSSRGLSVVSDDTVGLFSLGLVFESALSEIAKSTDWWRDVGAVLFDDYKNVILSTHNTHLPSEYGPYISGDPRAAFSKGIQIELSTAIHAEAMVIASAARLGVKTEGLNLLSTTFPCPVCAKLIAFSGISTLYFAEGYSMIESEEVLRNADVKIVRVE